MLSRMLLAQWRALAAIDKCPSIFLTTVDGWRALSPMDRVRSEWLSLANCWCVPNQMTSGFATSSLKQCELLHCWISSTQSMCTLHSITYVHCLFSCVNIFHVHQHTKLSIVGKAVERHTVSVTDFLKLGHICQIKKRSERGASRNTGF